MPDKEDVLMDDKEAVLMDDKEATLAEASGVGVPDAGAPSTGSKMLLNCAFSVQRSWTTSEPTDTRASRRECLMTANTLVRASSIPNNCRGTTTRFCASTYVR